MVCKTKFKCVPADCNPIQYVSPMDINDLFDGIMRSIIQFAVEIAERRLQEKMQEAGRALENGGKNSENLHYKQKRDMTSLPKRG